VALKLEAAALDQIKDHATRAYPEECCGALVGEQEGIDRRVKDAWPLANVAANAASNFAVDPSEYTEIERRAERSGAALLGFYHSHPHSAAAPSRSDLTQAWPSLSYLIIGADGGENRGITSWRLRDDRSAFENEEIIVWRRGS
jgi:proteasome lid subunit RPN8/RPN11